MARCGCGSTGCNCVLQQGGGVTITGAGTAASPYIISSPTPADAYALYYAYYGGQAAGANDGLASASFTFATTDLSSGIHQEGSSSTDFTYDQTANTFTINTPGVYSAQLLINIKGLLADQYAEGILTGDFWNSGCLAGILGSSTAKFGFASAADAIRPITLSIPPTRMAASDTLAWTVNLSDLDAGSPGSGFVNPILDYVELTVIRTA